MADSPELPERYLKAGERLLYYIDQYVRHRLLNSEASPGRRAEIPSDPEVTWAELVGRTLCQLDREGEPF